MSTEKERFELDHAIGVAEWLRDKLAPACAPDRILICGSVRRLRPDVGDIELVYVPRVEPRRAKDDFFSIVNTNLADEIIADLYQSRVLDKRKNVNGSETFGTRNKLMRHVALRIPVDLFSTTEECFWNYVVCRTGPAELNVEIATRARAHGLMWKPTSQGFARVDENDSVLEWFPVCSEREVFAKVGLPYREPWDR